MDQERAEVDDISEDLLDRFLAVERSREIVCVTVKDSLGTARRFLIAAGYLVPPPPEAGTSTPAQAALAAWRTWMREQRGLSERTIEARCHCVAGLLEVLTGPGGDLRWERLDASMVNEYVTERGRPYSAATRAHILDAVRALLRWALSTGRLELDFSAGILMPAHARRTLPRGVSAEQVAALLAVCDPDTPIGARDRAIVLVFTRLGLRAGEAARLALDDIDWSNAQLKVSGKGREHVLPIPVDVGEALTAWLRLRPPSLDRAVFVRMKAPRRVMTVSGISGVIARLSSLAGIEQIYAHRLRHTAAIAVLAGGGSLAEAKELLGHAYTVTTMAYAKVDLGSLRELVVPFGQVPR